MTSIYAPNEDNPQFLRTSFTIWKFLSVKKNILGGDFNLALDLGEDKREVWQKLIQLSLIHI